MAGKRVGQGRSRGEEGEWRKVVRGAREGEGQKEGRGRGRDKGMGRLE